MKRLLPRTFIFLMGALFSLSVILYPAEAKAQTTTIFMTADSVTCDVVHTHSSSSGIHDDVDCWTGQAGYSYQERYQWVCGGVGTRAIYDTSYPSVGIIAALCPNGHYCSGMGAACGYSDWRTRTVTVAPTYTLTDSTYDTTTPFVSMTLSCSDTDAYDGKAILTADISEGGYFEKWAWSDENQVVWSSEVNGGGTIYGYGTVLEITAIGTYYCTLLGEAPGFTISEKSTAITVNGTNVNVSNIFVGDCRMREFNKDTYAYDKTIRIGDVIASRVYIGDTLIHDDALYR